MGEMELERLVSDSFRKSKREEWVVKEVLHLRRRDSERVYL